MARTHLILHPETGRLVPAHEYIRPGGPRSSLPCPQVIGDTMEPVQSMLDGRMYDSKSVLRRTYRAAGVTEVGNDVKAQPAPKPKPDKHAIKASVAKAFSQAGLGS